MQIFRGEQDLVVLFSSFPSLARGITRRVDMLYLRSSLKSGFTLDSQKNPDERNSGRFPYKVNVKKSV